MFSSWKNAGNHHGATVKRVSDAEVRSTFLSAKPPNYSTSECSFSLHKACWVGLEDFTMEREQVWKGSELLSEDIALLGHELKLFIFASRF